MLKVFKEEGILTGLALRSLLLLLPLLSCFSRVRLCATPDGSPPGSPSLGFSRHEYWSGLPFLLQGILLTQ